VVEVEETSPQRPLPVTSATHTYKERESVCEREMKESRIEDREEREMK
jgi:hypothetical protein